tara:strand:- start:944 stop:2293 length:1350 start_codon:yes stop_codon:yes gene_type:complete
MFTIEDTAVVGTYYNVKYVAEVHIAETDIDLATSTAIGTFKTTPNNAGVGMFDFRPISESYVSPDNQGALGSEYKGDAATATTTHPLALIDKFSLNDNSVRYIKIKFSVEGATTATAIVLELDTEDSVQYTLINGYLKHTDVQDRDSSGNFGYNTQNFYFNKVLIPSDIPAKYLTNAPLTQYANDTDYGTVSFISTDNGAGNKLDKFTITYYQSNGTTIGTADEIDNTDANGGFTTFTTATKDQILHLGCYPANLRNWSTEFQGLLAAGTVTRYTVFGSNAAGNQITDLLYINLLCPNLKGFEPVRLKWLNQWGAWDYYTFKMKSTQSISTKGSTYQQLGGTWNESIYSPSGYKGGKKAFRVNATEKVVMNTEFVNQSEATWFEELVNSPEVYILDGFQTDTAIPLLSTYVTPVRLLTSNFTKKTVANDKLIQYTFEVEKSKTLRTQSV